MGMVILSMMFLASLGRKKESEESNSVEIVSPPIAIFEGPPLIPYDVPNPGQPGGGYEPHPDHHYKILSLVPYGLIPLAVFPNLYRGGNPSECVIFAEPDPVIVPSPPPPPIPIPPPYYLHDPYLRLRKKTHDRKNTRKFVKMKKNAHQRRHIQIDHRLYGFRCLVTIIDKKSCSTYKECKDVKDHESRYGQGYFFQPTTKSTPMNQNFKNNELPQVTSVSQLYPPIFHTHFKRQLGINYYSAATLC